MNPPLKYFRIASALNKKHHSFFINHHVHLRPNKNSLSVVSVHPLTPESGFRCPLKKNGEDQFDLLLDVFHAKKQELIPPGRSVVEKELQAWIIRHALTNNNEICFDKKIRFFTSELANGNNKRVVDILGYNVVTEALVIIELKSERSLQRLIEQVNAYETVVRNDLEFYRQALQLFGYPWKEDFPIEKIIVWPSANGPKRFPGSIREFQYKKEEHGYSFIELFSSPPMSPQGLGD